MMTHLIRLLVASSFLVTSGCVSLLPETSPAKPRYHITAVDPGALSGAPVDWSLSVEDPRTTRVYDTVKIAVSTAPGKVEYFANAEWADRAPRLFQTALVQSLEDSGRIVSVGDRTAIPIGDFALQTDIRAMELQVRGNARTVHVSVYARLTDGTSVIHTARLFEETTTAASDDADDVINAFDTAFDAVMARLISWSFEEGAAAN